jgi:tetratricopeptide (TPR) repeat protein
MMIRRSPSYILVWGFALALLTGCASQSPEMGEAETALEEGNYEAAVARADEALERDSANTDAYLFKARVLRQMADSTMPHDDYIELYRRAADAEADAMAVEDGDVDADVQEERQRIYDREMRRGESAYNRADKYGAEASFRRAIGFFGAAAATQPDSARPALNEAFSRLKVEQTRDVIPVLERYVERADTAKKVGYKILGELYVSTQQYGAATDLLDRGTAVYPTDPALQALRLNAYNRSGDVDEALSVYREQLEHFPERAAYRYNYGALLLKAERYSEAIDQLTQAVELRPDDARGQYNLGAAYLNAAQVRADSIAAAEGDGSDGVPSAESISEEQRRQLEQRREALLEKAIPPLERARALTEEPYAQIENKTTIREDACRALLVAYVQTSRPNRAAQVEACTGFAQSGR